jgi:biotin-(acetyl-CoA carboxylase) ligase
LLLESVDCYAAMLVNDGPGPVLEAFERHSTYARGKRVRVEQAADVMEGVTAGLDRHGYLIVRRDDGSEATILAGGVRAIGS